MLPELSALDGLTDDVPRAAKFTARTRTSRRSLLVLIACVACLLAWSHDRDLGRMNALRAQGRMTNARVTGRHTTQGKSTSYYLDYTFDGDKIWVNGAENVGEDEYNNTRPGEVIPVTFLPSYPQMYELGTMTEERIRARQGVWLWGEGGAFALFGLWAFGMEATFRRHLSLLRDGSVAAGTVTERSLGPTQGLFHVTYQFLADGKLCLERISSTELFYEQMELGQVLTVLYDPRHPSHSIPYRMLTDVALDRPQQ